MYVQGRDAQRFLLASRFDFPAQDAVDPARHQNAVNSFSLSLSLSLVSSKNKSPFVLPRSTCCSDLGSNRLATLNKDAFKSMIQLIELYRCPFFFPIHLSIDSLKLPEIHRSQQPATITTTLPADALIYFEKYKTMIHSLRENCFSFSFPVPCSDLFDNQIDYLPGSIFDSLENLRNL